MQYLIFDRNSLEVFRQQSWFSFYSVFTKISYYLVLISATGLLGLIFASIVSFYVNKKMAYKQSLLVISIMLVFILNKLFIDITQIINFRSNHLEHFSVKSLMIAGSFISVTMGLIILHLPKHLGKLNYYLKVHS